MKKFLFAATFALFASTQAFAIIGVGAHYFMNTGSLGANSGDIQDGKITVKQESADGLQGLGFKLWIDFFPVIDIEGTFNIAASRYKTTLFFPAPIGKVPLSFPVEAPYSMLFDDASPIYGVATGDISVTYPFDIVPIITPYIGVGFSYFASTAVVDAGFVKEFVNDLDLSDPAALAALADGGISKIIGDKVAEKIEKTGYETGMGGHIIAGVRLKLPIIPIAAYANCKRYFGGNLSSRFNQGFAFEIGGGFAL